MIIQLWNFSSETIYVQDMSFVVKGYSMELILQIILNPLSNLRNFSYSQLFTYTIYTTLYGHYYTLLYAYAFKTLSPYS